MNGLALTLRLLPAPLGGLLLVAAERLWPGTALASSLTALGLLAIAVQGAACLRPRRAPPATGADPAASAPPAAASGDRAAGLWTAAPAGLWLLAAALYHATAWLPPRTVAGVRWDGIAQGGWMLAAVAGAVLQVFLGAALLSQRRAPHPDPRRLRAAGAAGLALALAALLAILLNAGLARLGWQWHAAYFRTTAPGTATQDVARALPALVAGYLTALQRAAGPERLELQLADADLRPALAEAFKARGNGWIVFRRGETRHPVRIGDTLEQARDPLRRLDGTVYARLLELSRPPLTVYLTVGHGERNDRRGHAEGGLTRFQAMLRARNFTVRPLGLGEGAAEAVPDDAALVIAAGPTEPFLAGELAALRAYLERGGRLLAFLEPVQVRATAGGARPLRALLADYGVRYRPVVQANDRIYGRRTRTRADHALLATVGYERHPALATVTRTLRRHPVLLLGSGALHPGRATPTLQVLPVLRGMAGTWGDRDGDYAFDAHGEQRGTPILALSVAAPAPRRDKAPPAAEPAEESPDGGPRLLVFADVDLASDLLIRNRANQGALQDALAWLAAEALPAGLPESEEDVRIRHASADDWLWFYLPVLGVPALVLAIGLVRTRRGRGGAHG